MYTCSNCNSVPILKKYWEACGAVHQMMSKWLDATVHAAVFHMQCSHYDKIKPPSFFDHPEFMKIGLSVNREVLKSPFHRNSRNEISIPNFMLKKNQVRECSSNSNNSCDSSYCDSSFSISCESEPIVSKTIMSGSGRLDGGWGLLSDVENNIYDLNTTHQSSSWNVGVTPSLFLQELVHLSSLCVGVAFCTLRNDLEGAVSPLNTYVAGSPWPETDPDMMEKDKNQCLSRLTIWMNLKHMLGIDKTPEDRTKYNAARPMSVLGGVSTNEILRLQHARGTLAKTQLTWYWLSEFVTRESIAGSTGKVAPPIISRIHQFLSDGMTHYNHARKIMFTPFPFPHAQISALSILVITVYVPFLMDQFTDEMWVGVSLTFLTVLCLAGLHEVARVLENPFRNVPNDVPLCTLLATYNEALISVCSGYHPDHYWHAGVQQNDLIFTRPQSEDNGQDSSQTKPNKKKEVSSIEKVQYENKIQELEILLLNYSKQLKELSVMSQSHPPPNVRKEEWNKV